MKTNPARLLSTALLLTFVLALAPAVHAGWSNITVWSYANTNTTRAATNLVTAAIRMQVLEIPGYDTFTLRPVPNCQGGVSLRIVVSGCTFQKFQYVMDWAGMGTNEAAETDWGWINAPTYETPPDSGFVFSMRLSSLFLRILESRQMPRVKFFANVKSGVSTDVTLALSNATLQQVSVVYGDPKLTGMTPPFVPFYSGAGKQGLVKVYNDTCIGTVNVIGGLIVDVRCLGRPGQIGAVYCRKVTRPKKGFTYGGVIGCDAGSADDGGITTPGNIGIVLANNGFGSAVRPGVVPIDVAGRVASGYRSVAPTALGPGNIGAVYMPAGTWGGRKQIISAGSGFSATPANALHMGSVGKIVIGNQGPTADVKVYSNLKPKVSGKGKIAAGGTIYTAESSSYQLNTP